MNDHFESAVKRTQRGIVALDSVVTGLRYVRSVIRPNHGGSYLQKGPGELFIGFDGAGPRSWIQNFALVGTPVGDMPSFCRLTSDRIDLAPPGALRFIEWRGCGHALMLASDPTYIGDTWLAFIPIDQIKNLIVEQPKVKG